eukprot:TRINITY_DN9841_c0_g1_i1.p1 TRINITY_DN9841_c0_g1~~TRINITY_DN9841_c0_g1_i1.p1  ORF type:complete len:189 (-),score=32.81 TRINITY_DN9841_c0_g1_i1:50-616(-)
MGNKNNGNGDKRTYLRESVSYVEHKIVVYGMDRCGKSTLTCQYISSIFIEQFDPTKQEKYRKYTTIDKTPYIFDIIDTVNTLEFSSIRDQEMRNNDAFILVYSITDISSYNEILKLRQQILRVKNSPFEPMIIVANKSDLENERKVSIKEGEELAKSLGCPIIEVSSKNRENIERIFELLVKEIKKKY